MRYLNQAALPLALAALFAPVAQVVVAESEHGELKPVGTLTCRAGEPGETADHDAIAGLSCTLTFADRATPLQFLGELHQPKLSRTARGDEIVVWKVLSSADVMPMTSIAGEYGVKPEHDFQKALTGAILVGGREDSVALQLDNKSDMVQPATRMTLRMTAAQSLTASVSF